MSLSFAQASFVVGFISGVHPERSGALESRIKQWQKMGFPDGVNVGRGVKAEYGPTQLCQLVLMIKLLNVGLTPERAIQVIRTAWPVFKDGFAEATSCMAAGSDHLHYYFVKLDALTDLREPDANHMHVYVDTWTSVDIENAFADWSSLPTEDRKIAEGLGLAIKNQLAVSFVLEIDSLLILLWVAVTTCGGDLALFQDEFADWYQERAKRRDHEPQESVQRFLNFYQTSVAGEIKDFDVVEAARTTLRKVAKHAGNPQT